MFAYDPSEWSDLFVAAAGASAALAGLVFVAVSINVERILQFAGLPERALETILLLMTVLLVSIVGLVPGQGSTALGLELLGLGFVVGAGTARLPVHTGSPQDGPAQALVRWGIRALALVPVLVGGISLLAESGDVALVVGEDGVAALVGSAHRCIRAVSAAGEPGAQRRISTSRTQALATAPAIAKTIPATTQ